MLFEVGKIHWSKELLDCSEISCDDLIRAFERYISGDWGEVSQEQSLSNDLALTSGHDTIGKYVSEEGMPFYISTTKEGTRIALFEEQRALSNSLT